MNAPLPPENDVVPNPAVVRGDAPSDVGSDVPWQRLDAKMIWVDALRVLVSLLPTAVAVMMVGVDINWGTMWPVLGVAVYGIVGAGADVLRWIKTRYRITDDFVERRTGLFIRRYRSLRRDRIRSVDVSAKLRHRIARLRIIKIGAGQQNAAGESALVLDALSRDAAEALRSELLDRRETGPASSWQGGPSSAPSAHTPDVVNRAQEVQVFERIRWSWIIYNLFNVWAYVMAIGLLWGAVFLLPVFGLNPVGFVVDREIWNTIGWGWSAILATAGVGALGVVGLAVNFVSENWRFELARAPGETGTVLRTTQGLLRKREINRDDNRLRGVQISEPLLWRWMRMADTTVITTGLSVWSMAPTIIPRGPRAVARRVAAAVLDEESSPFDAPLRPHPVVALWRRLLWASLLAALVVASVWFAGTEVAAVPGSAWWVTALIAWPVAVALAVTSYRALGHGVAGDYVVTRSGVMAWATAALQRSAVSGVAVRQSVLQRRLGLMTVSLSTAAGYGTYRAPDIDAREAVAFATAGTPGLLTPFVSHIGRSS